MLVGDAWKLVAECAPEQGVYLVKKEVVGFVVFMNMLMIGLETDGVDWPIWGVAEVLFVLFYCYLATGHLCKRIFCAGVIRSGV